MSKDYYYINGVFPFEILIQARKSPVTFDNVILAEIERQGKLKTHYFNKIAATAKKHRKAIRHKIADCNRKIAAIEAEHLEFFV